MLVPRSIWGEMDGSYFTYWLIWAIVTVSIPLVWLVSVWLLKVTANDWIQVRAHLRNAVLVLFQLLALPAQLALARTFGMCEPARVARCLSGVTCLHGVFRL